MPTSDPRLDAPETVEAERRRLNADPRLPARRLDRDPEDGWLLADPWPMRPRLRRAFRALVRAVLPPPPAPEIPIERVELMVRRLLRYMLPLTATGFVWAVRVLEWAPRWTLSSVHRFSHLDRDRADRLLARLGASRWLLLRQPVAALRGAILSVYFDQDEVHHALGYRPAVFMRSRVELRDRLTRGEPARAADFIGPFSGGVT